MKPTHILSVSLALSACFIVAAQVPLPPANLSVSPTTTVVDETIVPVPVVYTNGHYQAFWYNPPYILRTNGGSYVATMWIPECSNDGSFWKPCGNETTYVPLRAVRVLTQPCLTCLHYTQVEDSSWLVRIRRINY